MTETTQAAPTPATEEKDTTEPDNPSFYHCLDSYMRAFKRAKRQGRDHSAAIKIANKAYSSAIPLLSSNDNIDDFVACVAHGMLLELISGPDGARLLYAAQVASGLRKQPTPPKSAQ